MYHLIEKCLLTQSSPIIVETHKSKKHLTRQKHREMKIHNTHPIYKAFKYKVITDWKWQMKYK